MSTGRRGARLRLFPIPTIEKNRPRFPRNPVYGSAGSLRHPNLSYMKSEERILQLPQPIIDRLREVIARIRRLQWIKGSLLTLAAAVAALLVIIALDAAFSLESLPLRLALTASALAATAAVAWYYWVRPLARRISLTAVARWVESRHPELQERISTAVELLDDRHGANDAGSRELLEAVVQDAVADVSQLDPAQDLSPRRTRPAQWLAGSAVAALLLLVTIWPSKIPRLLSRAIAPMADQGNAWADRLRVLTKSQVLAIGDPLTISVAHAGRPERIELHLTSPDGKRVVEMLQPDPSVAVPPGEAGYSLRLPSVKETFTAKVTAGKAVSAPFTITAIARPEHGPWTLTYHYPAYTGRPDETKTNASGEIAAPVGTKVSATAALNRAMAKGSVTINAAAVPDFQLRAAPPAPEVQWSTILTPGLDALWSLQLEDEHGIQNLPVELPIRSMADLPPVITLETPVADRMELRPTEKLPLTYLVKEDVGLSAVRIRIRPQDKPEFLLPPEIPPTLTQGTRDEYAGTAVLDLAKVVVPDGQEIRVSLMAADRVPPEFQGPQLAWSREIVIRLNRWTRPLVEKNFEDQHQELRKKMEEVKRELYSAKGRMNDKPDRLRDEEKLSDNTLKDIEASTSHLQQAEALLKELTQRMKETAYARQTPAMEEISQQMVQPAKAGAQDIPLTDNKETRAMLARNSKDLLENAIKQMEQEQQQMEQSRQAVQQVAKLSDIAEQQQRLAAEAAHAAQAAQPTSSKPESSPTASSKPESSPTASQPGEAAPATPPAMAAAPPAPTDNEQREWLEDQRRVAQRAKELMEQNNNSNPQGTQEQMKQAAAQAAQLSAEAETLAKQEAQLANTMATATTAEAKQQTATAQQQLAAQTAALQEKAKAFTQKSTNRINQSTETQSTAFAAEEQLETAHEQATAATTAMTAAAREKPPTAAAPEAIGSPTAPAPTSPSEATPAASGTSAPELASASAPASPAATASQDSKSAEAPSAMPSGAEKTNTSRENRASLSPSPSLAAQSQAAAQATSASLLAAAESLKSLGTELNSLAGMLADHSNSLGEGAQLAGTAVDQAAKPQQEQGKGPAMQQGAAAAQQAADQLATAANTMLQAMSIPASAKSSQASASSQGKGKPTNGQPQPSQPGQEGKDGLQLDTASSAIPPELAKLGLTADDWMKLKSSLKGVDSANNASVPAEYRDLVKAYFGALAKGNPAP